MNNKNKKKVVSPPQPTRLPLQKPEPVSFVDAYATLARVAKTLEDMAEPDLDKIVPLMSEAANAYDLCSARVKAVETLLKERGWLNGDVSDQGVKN